MRVGDSLARHSDRRYVAPLRFNSEWQRVCKLRLLMNARTLRKLLLLLIPLFVLRGQPPPADCQRRTAEDFVPMTRTDRAAHYLNALIGPQAILVTFVRTGVNQAFGRPREWGRDPDPGGFGLRLASDFSQHAISESFEDGIALGLGEDNRYFASGKQGFGQRLRYAVASSFLARHDNGSRSLSFSAMGGPATGAFLSRLWQPDSTRSAGDGAVSFGISIGIRVGLNVAREFSPGFVRRLLE